MPQLRHHSGAPGRRAFIAALTLALALVSVTADAQGVTLGRDIDLVAQDGLVHYSMTDFRWGYYPAGPRRDVSIADCGCLLAALATVMNHTSAAMLPWFPTRFDYFGGSNGANDFNPRYLDLFLNFGPNPGGNPSGPGLSYPAGWGYKAFAAGTCGTIPLLQALQTVGTDGLGAAVGFSLIGRKGFGPAEKDIVNRNLLAGRPTIVAVRRSRNALADADHVVLIAGWDETEQKYEILDPAHPRSGVHGPFHPHVPLTASNDGVEPTYADWLSRVKGIIDVRLGGFAGSTPSFLFGDDPSPIEILMTGPDGRRTGLDPVTGASFEENGDASYWTFGPWTDPLGEVSGGTAPRFVVMPNAPSGTYHFTVTGTAAGPLHLSAETLFGGTRILLREFTGTFTPGEVRKYELAFSRTGASSVAEVNNFTPHAVAGDDLQGRTGKAIAFDGRRSFDVDGALSMVWDFGDGATGPGAQAQHAYTNPGDYTVTLTVTDAHGATATDRVGVRVILSQVRPVADASGPYLGFVSQPVAPPPFGVFFDARGSSDPNGDPLTYRWNFGDGSPAVTIASPFAGHPYMATGRYTVTLVVNDGLEDSAPVTTEVEIGEAPTKEPYGNSIATLAPSCGNPGDTVTITLGIFGRYEFWNFGTQGALPAFPPNRLPLGATEAPGELSLGFGSADVFDVPFKATLLSPGRYMATAAFTVPDVAPGSHDVTFGETYSVPFVVGCPIPLNQPPVANAGGPYAAASLGTPVSFDGSASTDPDGDALTYEWHFGDGEIGTGIGPAHAYANAGQYLVTLVVSDGHASSMATAGAQSFARVVVAGASGDTIPPTTTAVVSPAAGASGWHRVPVTVDLTALDDPGGSGVRDIAYGLTGAQVGAATVPGATAQANVDAEGTTLVTFFATDHAGNHESEQTRTIRIDRTPPVVSITSPAVGSVVTLGAVVLANYGCEDGGSGIASCTGPVAGGVAIDTTSIGARTFVVTGMDAAGNTAVASVGYTVSAAARLVCDVDGDRDVDDTDLNLVRDANNGVPEPEDPRDANRDGRINVADYRYCSLRLTAP